MNIQDIYSGTVMGSFPDDLRSGQEKRRERKKEREARQVEKDSRIRAKLFWQFK